MSHRFDTALAAERISELLNKGGPAIATRVGLRHEVLRILIQVGYDRARFYERCPDVGKEEEILVLVAEEVAERDADCSRVGKCIPALEADIGFSETAEQTVFLWNASDFSPRHAWIDELELTDRVWVDINLRVLGRAVGVIAVDWEGEKDDLTDADRRFLGGIGTMVAQHLQLRPPDRVHEFREAIGNHPATKATKDDAPVGLLLDDGLLAIAEILDARLAALFEYRWSTGVIVKKREYDTTLGRKRWKKDQVLVLPEEYDIDQNLTGKAWANSTYRHVPHFSRADDPVLQLINKDSKDRHTAYLGEEPFTCLYGRVESMEPRFMVRLMNRGESRLAPYVGERLLLEEMLEELRAAVDKATALGRTASLEQATQLAAANVDPETMLAELGPLLDREDVENAIVLCHRRHSNQFSFTGQHGDLLEELQSDRFVEWKKDSLYRHLIEKPDLTYIDRYAVRNHAAGSVIARQLHADITGLVAIRMAAGDTSGVMLIPLKVGLPVRRKNLYDYCGVGRLSLLNAYGSLLADVIDSAVARARADGARRALGVLGHELATPLARLGGSAHAGLSEIREVAIDVEGQRDSAGKLDGTEAIDQMRAAAVGYRNQIQSERRSIGAAISLAPLVAQESADGRLELQARDVDLGGMVLRAMSQAGEEARERPRRVLIDGRWRIPTYNFTRSDSIPLLGQIVGDPGFLYLAILNVMRNAYKYSIPSPRSGICSVHVSGQRQKGMKIVVVENIGREIDPDMTDLIFEPWVRLQDDRDSTARTGMGIGLFFSRRIAVAHHGTVLCTGSEEIQETETPSHDASRKEVQLDRMLEDARIGSRRGARDLLSLEDDVPFGQRRRYRTTFEIRLGDAMTPGPHVHEWNPNFKRSRTRRRSNS